MKKLQLDWSEISIALNQKLASCTLTIRELSDASGIDYYAARRYLAVRAAKNRSRNAEALCTFFGVSLSKSANMQQDILEIVFDAVRESWDGSESHARLIADLVTSTKLYQVRSIRR